MDDPDLTFSDFHLTIAELGQGDWTTVYSSIRNFEIEEFAPNHFVMFCHGPHNYHARGSGKRRRNR